MLIDVFGKVPQHSEQIHEGWAGSLKRWYDACTTKW